MKPLALQLNFNPFPTLKTERLNLRQFSLDDAADYFVIRADKEAMKFIDKPLHKSVTDTQALIKKIEDGVNCNEAIAWAISLKENSKFIGTISYHIIEKENYRAEIGYMLHPEYWNKGFVSEALEKVLDFGFAQLKLHSIEAKINPANKISGKLLTKFGFIKEAYFKENYYYEGKFLDTEVYSLVKK